ncbi:MAG: hypothetical protein GX149_02755 [Acholeplasmataceae bacterium]|nr:hypothetical protein [Acholeplasmataceae bacterium]
MFKPLEFYKPDLAKTIKETEKTIANARKHQGGNISFRALPPSDVDFYEKMNLLEYEFPQDNKRYAKDLCSLLEKSFHARRDVDDNFIPVITPNLGIGDYSAFVAGEIIFQKDTSWSQPVLKEVNDYQKLPPLGTAKWYGLFLEIIEEILKISGPSGIPFSRGFFSPLDLAHALRGEAIFFDFYDNPDEVKQLIDFCADATIKFASEIHKVIKKYLKNSKYGLFYTEGLINMSEDIACMISGEQYQEFCAPFTQKVIDHFGDGHMHTHSRSMYLVKEICSLNNVVNLWLPTDPNAPKPIEHGEQLALDSRGANLAIDCENFQEIVDNFASFKAGNFSITLPVKDIAEAKLYTAKFKQLK